MNYKHDFKFTGNIYHSIPVQYDYVCIKCNKTYLSIPRDKYEKYRANNDMLNKIYEDTKKKLGLNTTQCI